MILQIIRCKENKQICNVKDGSVGTVFKKEVACIKLGHVQVWSRTTLRMLSMIG